MVTTCEACGAEGSLQILTAKVGREVRGVGTYCVACGDLRQTARPLDRSKQPTPKLTPEQRAARLVEAEKYREELRELTQRNVPGAGIELARVSRRIKDLKGEA